MTCMKTFLGVIFAVAVVTLSAEAQRPTFANPASKPMPPRHLTRGLLWHGFLNTGSEGARPVEQDYAGLYTDLDYPGFALTSWSGSNPNDFAGYYGAQRSTGSMLVDLTTHNGRGHGWWIATKLGGKASVSYSSPLALGKEESDDIVAMAVNPRVDFGGRFSNVGNDVGSLQTGLSMANWWPTTTVQLDAIEPRELLNYKIGQYTTAATDNFPEDIVLSKWTTKLGLTGEKAAYAWNHPEYDDFVITEWTFENTGDSNGDRTPDIAGGGNALQNVYFSFQHRMMTSSAGVSRSSYRSYFADYGPQDGCNSPFGVLDNPQDDKIKYTESPNYDGPASAKGLKMLYQYDWNNYCLTGGLADDVGDPYRVEIRCSQCNFPSLTKAGDLTSPAWVGVAEVDVDPADGFVGDTGVYQSPKVAQQPFAHNLFFFVQRAGASSTGSAFNSEEPDPNQMNDDTLSQMITSTPDPTYFTRPRDQRPTRGSGDPRKGVPLLALDENPTRAMPYMPDPDWEWKGRHGVAAAYSSMDTYGPYDLAPGQKVKFVFAYVAGAPVEANFTEFNRKQDASELKKEEGGAAFANLVKHLRKAKEAYALGYDLPNQPPDVDATVTSSENAQNLITWKGDPEKSNNPDTGKPDVGGYRVFRSATLPGIWNLISDVKASGSATYSVEDKESLAGFQYYYTVRAYQGSGNAAFKSRVTGRAVDGGVTAYESGPGDPSTFFYPPKGTGPHSPVQVPSAAADRLEREIAVVPNPYINDGVHTYEATTRLRVLNVPRKCIVRIFSVAGDLVGEVTHDSPTVGEAAYLQFNRTHTTQLRFGVYFVTVESLMPESQGKIKSTKFVIIR